MPLLTLMLIGSALSGSLQGQQTAGPPMPKPGAEHVLLKEDAGTWDAVVEMFPPGGKPMKAKGVETSTIGCGGLCLITDFKGELMPGSPFHGHGLMAWDFAKKKYVTSWTDSMSPGLATGEATWDADSRTLTGWMSGPEMSGETSKFKTVAEYKGGTRVYTMYGSGPDGKETPTLRITYTRRK